MISPTTIQKSNPYKLSQDLKVGKDGELLFRKIFTRATDSDRQFDHIDFEFDEIGVDVKGLKRCHKAGYILLEMINVAGKPGWCHKDSGADFLAFQFPEGFYMATRNDLLALLKEILPDWEAPDRSLNNNDFEKRLYTYCGRPRRKDVFTYIRKEDLINIPYTFLPV